MVVWSFDESELERSVEEIESTQGGERERESVGVGSLRDHVRHRVHQSHVPSVHTLRMRVVLSKHKRKRSALSPRNHNWVEIWLGHGSGLFGEAWTFLEASPAGPGEHLLNPCDKWFCNPSCWAMFVVPIAVFEEHRRVVCPVGPQWSNKSFTKGQHFSCTDFGQPYSIL